MSGGSSRRYPPELRERAVRMVAEIRGQHDSEWAAISEVARLLGVGCAETVRKWVRQAQVDAGARLSDQRVSGLTGAVHAPTGGRW
ncbi:transposase [Mycobacterium tuberculosis]|nr:transposase [Mycobacterium tuberculosis]